MFSGHLMHKKKVEGFAYMKRKAADRENGREGLSRTDIGRKFQLGGRCKLQHHEH